jgi:hypothetical protein
MAYHDVDGALFKDAPANDGKKHPIMHLALEVLGVRMNVAVWPAETAKTSGVKYWPCSGSYAKSETKRLIPVDVAQLPPPQAGTGGKASPAPVVDTNQPASVDNADTDLPF